MLRPLPSARVATPPPLLLLLQTYCPLQHDPVDLLEKFRLRRKLRPALQRLAN